MRTASPSALPHGWVETTLAEVVEPRIGKSDPQARPEARYIGMDQVEAHSMRLLGTREAGSMKSAANVFRGRDVLYGRLRPYLNKVYQPDFDGMCSSEFIVMPGNRLVLAWRLGLSRVCGVEDEPIGGCLAAEDRSPILLQGFEPDALHRQGRLAVHVELAAALGFSDTQPVGRLIARSQETRALTERLEQDRA